MSGWSGWWCVVEDHREQGGDFTVWGPYRSHARALAVEAERTKVVDEAWGGEDMGVQYGISVSARRMAG